ncbi:MAG: hypothetical protein QM784_02795 [Polyangiaceae bacterium]
MLERRALVEDTAEAIADCYYRLAKIQLEQFHQAGTALATARSALERVSNDHVGTVALLESLLERRELFEEVAELLEGVYRGTGKTEQLAAIYEKKVALAEGATERLESRRNLARVLEEDCKDLSRACSVLGEALAEDPSDQMLLDELERLLSATGDFAKLASQLSQAIVAHPELPADVRRDLWMRVAGWLRDKAADAAGAESALLWAHECDRTNDEILQQIEALRRVPGKEAALVEVLRLRGRGAMDEEQRLALYREAKAISVQLGDAVTGEAIVREVLALDERNAWALAELTEIRRQVGDHAETLSLLLRQIELEVDAGLLRTLRHDAAEVARDEIRGTSRKPSSSTLRCSRTIPWTFGLQRPCANSFRRQGGRTTLRASSSDSSKSLPLPLSAARSGSSCRVSSKSFPATKTPRSCSERFSMRSRTMRKQCLP